MTDTNRTKFDNVSLAGLFPPEGKAGGPRIEGGPKPGPVVLSNTPETTEPVPTPPPPAWVMEALGKLVAPTRRKAAVLAAVAALGGGAYTAKLLTNPGPGTMSAEVAKSNPMPAPTTPPGPVATIEPNVLPTMTSNLDNKPRLTEAEMYAANRTYTPPASTNTNTNFNIPDVPVIGSTNTGQVNFNVPPVVPTPTPPAIGDIRLVNDTVPPINVPAIPATSGGGVGSGAIAPAPVTPYTPPSNTGTGNGGLSLPDINVPNITPTQPTTPAPVPRIDFNPGGGSIGGAIIPEQPKQNPVVTPAPVNTSTPSPSITYTPPAAPSASIVPTATAPRTVETSFDVDVHTVRQGDSYAAISKKYYGEDTFAQALQAYDTGRANRTEGQVHVPPVWVLRKRYMNNNAGYAEPVRRAETIPAERVTNTGGNNWQPGTGRGKVYTAPRTMTMREIAKLAYGDENKWTAVWDLNLNLSTDSIPAGAKVNLPNDAQIGQ